MRYPSITHRGTVNAVIGFIRHFQMDCHHGLLVDPDPDPDPDPDQRAKISQEGRAGVERLAVELLLDEIKALVATDERIDHAGRFPWLLSAGFKCPIVCNEPSVNLQFIARDGTFKLSLSVSRSSVI